MEKIQKLLSTVSDLKFIGLAFNQNIVQKKYNEDIFYIIGNDYEDVLGIKQSNLSVFSISENEKVFINSSFEQLIDCIYYFNQIIDLLEEDYSEKKRKKEVNTVSKRIKEIDKDALTEDDSWWSLILEQVEDGLL
jgi:hypothetical protein